MDAPLDALVRAFDMEEFQQRAARGRRCGHSDHRPSTTAAAARSPATSDASTSATSTNQPSGVRSTNPLPADQTGTAAGLDPRRTSQPSIRASAGREWIRSWHHPQTLIKFSGA